MKDNLSNDPTERIKQLQSKLRQAHQVIGVLLAGADGDDPAFNTESGQAILDYFSRDEYDESVLPWTHPMGR